MSNGSVATVEDVHSDAQQNLHTICKGSITERKWLKNNANRLPSAARSGFNIMVLLITTAVALNWTETNDRVNKTSAEFFPGAKFHSFQTQDDDCCETFNVCSNDVCTSDQNRKTAQHKCIHLFIIQGTYPRHKKH